ncbi:MAG: hypothetical protein Q8L09_02420 [Candidatus Moranbacteria bacterium]|nr:hypothetical protein [Candidatus Moranbacteria bacterium]
MNKKETGSQIDNNGPTNEGVRLQDIHERIDLLKSNLEKIEFLLENKDLSQDDLEKLSGTIKLVQEELGKSNFVIDFMTKDINVSSK